MWFDKKSPEELYPPKDEYQRKMCIRDRHIIVNGGKMGETTQKLYDTLTGIQYGRIPDKFGWTVEVK